MSLKGMQHYNVTMLTATMDFECTGNEEFSTQAMSDSWVVSQLIVTSTRALTEHAELGRRAFL